MATYDRTDWLRTRPGLWRSLLLADLHAEMDAVGVDRAVVVAAGRTAAHNRWCLATAGAHVRLAAVVAGVELEAPELADRLDEMRAAGPLVGARGGMGWHGGRRGAAGAGGARPRPGREHRAGRPAGGRARSG